MSESPIIRLAAWMYAHANCGLPIDDDQFKSELEYFYKEHRSSRSPNWTNAWVESADEAYAYMKEERE